MNAAAAVLRERAAEPPRVGVVLGSGLAGAAVFSLLLRGFALGFAVAGHPSARGGPVFHQCRVM